MPMVLVAQIQAAADITTAANIALDGSLSHDAVIDLIGPVAAQIIASDATIKQAAADAAEEAVAEEMVSAGLLVGIPTEPVTEASLVSLPVAWTQRTMSSPYSDAYTDIYSGTWNSQGRYGQDVPLLKSGQIDESVVPATIARISDIPDIPDVVQDAGADALVSSFMPIFGARVAHAVIAQTACAVVFSGSSTTARIPGYTTRLLRLLQQVYPVSGDRSDQQVSPDANFTALTEAGLHGYNAGKSGATSANFLTDADSDRIASLSPALIEVMVGSNDYQNNRAPAEYRSLLLSRLGYLDSKLSLPTQFVLVHPYERMNNTDPRTYEWSAYRDVLAEIAASRANTLFIDLNDAYVVNGVPGDDSLNLISSDKIHQTTQGNRFMSDLLAGYHLA